MRIPVLYGSDIRKDFSSEVRYVAERLGVTLSESWDGKGELDFPETSKEIREELLSFIPEANLSFDTGERFLHSVGKSSPEILMVKHGSVTRIVDAVVYPEYGNLERILSGLLEHGYGATIFGGGTSVSGSLMPGSGKKNVAISTSRFKKARVWANYAVLGAGMRGPEAEETLNAHGYTLGNFPESFIFSTVGGWLATKAVGQESNQYGGIENMVIGARMTTSTGEIHDGIVPRESVGMDTKDIALGSDGRYGVITDVAVRTSLLPRDRYYDSRIYRTFRDGIAALSRTIRYPTVARLSDEVETEFALKGAGNSTAMNVFRKYIGMRGYGNGALLVVVNNDSPGEVVTTGSMGTGKEPARTWIRGRYSRPGIANVLWKNGLVPDTLETSATWDRIYGLYTNVKKNFHALRDELSFRGEIMAHISHLYREGACIYFTYIFSHDDEQGTLGRIRDTIIRSFIESGGAVTHHHGYGRFFSPYMDPRLLELQNRIADPLFGGKTDGE